MKKTIQLFKLGFFILVAFCLFSFAKTHDIHNSLTRIEYKSEDKRIEVSILLFSDDLIKSLESKNKKKINLKNTVEIDKLIQSYLIENFILKDSVGKSSELKWIRKELNSDSVWIYLEIPFKEKLEGKQLQNTIFFETFTDQINLVICKSEQKKADLSFKIGDKLQVIQFKN